jgi:hypothetical protein
VLCAGCRVAICVKTDETLTGCLGWNKSIEEPDFIYHCPYCARVLNTISLVCVVLFPGGPAQLNPVSSASSTRGVCGIRTRSCSDMTHPC